MSEQRGATTAQVAELLEITPRRVQQLAAEGWFPKIERDRYSLAGCVRGYVRYWRERAEGRGTNTQIGQAKLEKERLEIRRRELEIAKAEGQLVPLDDHLEIVARIMGQVRSKLLGLPGPWGPRIVGIQNPVEGTEAIRALADEAIADLRTIAGDIEGEQPDRALPDDFPGLAKLMAADVKTYGQLRALEDVTSVRGIGPATARKIEATLEGAA